MDGILVSLILGVTCNCVYDILKSYRLKFGKDEIENTLKEFMQPYVDSALDCGSFVKYLSSIHIKNVFRNYLLYNAYRRVPSLENKTFHLNRRDFIDNVTKNAIEFVKTETDGCSNIDPLLVRSYFEGILGLIEDRMLRTIPKEFMVVQYFLSLKMDELEKKLQHEDFFEEFTHILELIMQRIDELENNIAENLKSGILIDDICMENIRSEYLGSIRARFDNNYIYGIGFKRLSEFYVFPDFMQHREYIQHSYLSKGISWKEIFNQSNMISVIGGPGYGKTVFLYNLICSHEELTVADSREILPVYCNLKRYGTLFGNKAYSIEEFILDSMIDSSGMDRYKLNRDFLNYFLYSGRCLVLLDALDEVEPSERFDLCSKITSFFSHINKNNKICITSRDQGFIPQTSIIYRVCSPKIEQVEIYVDKMIILGCFHRPDKERFLKECSHLIEQNFLTSYLILSLLVNIYKSERELPDTKVDLYEKCVQYIAIKREMKQENSHYNFLLINSILNNSMTFERISLLAKPNNIELYKNDIIKLLVRLYSRRYSDRNTTLNAVDEFLRFCTERTELIVPGSKDNYYRFFHRSFFEFFYSKHIVAECKSSRELLKKLIGFTADSEMYELTSSILKNQNYKRYESLLDYFLNVLKNNQYILSSRILKAYLLGKISMLMSVTQESYFLRELYSMCFNEEKLLFAILDMPSNIATVLLRAHHSEKIRKDLETYYITELEYACRISSQYIRGLISQEEEQMNYIYQGLPYLFKYFITGLYGKTYTGLKGNYFKNSKQQIAMQYEPHNKAKEVDMAQISLLLEKLVKSL